MSSFTTQYNHKRRVLERVSEVFWWVRHGYKSHREMLNLFETLVYSQNSWKRLTQYNQSYVKGVIDTHLEYINRNELEWRVYHPDLGHVEKEDYSKLDDIWSEVVGKLGASFWKGTQKVWSGDPDVFEMYDQDPKYGYRIDDPKDTT